MDYPARAHRAPGRYIRTMLSRSSYTAQGAFREVLRNCISRVFVCTYVTLHIFTFIRMFFGTTVHLYIISKVHSLMSVFVLIQRLPPSRYRRLRILSFFCALSLLYKSSIVHLAVCSSTKKHSLTTRAQNAHHTTNYSIGICRTGSQRIHSPVSDLPHTCNRRNCRSALSVPSLRFFHKRGHAL